MASTGFFVGRTKPRCSASRCAVLGLIGIRTKSSSTPIAA
jgi:hypothetical protein